MIETDPLDALLKKNSEAFGTNHAQTQKSEDDILIPTEPEHPSQITTPENDIYGENDMTEEMKAEELAEEERRQEIINERVAEREANKKPMMPPNPYDHAYTDEAVGFQADKLAIVNNMANQVIRKHQLIGEIPVSSETDPDLRMHVMGDLVEIYQKTGEEITPEFEEVILKNWQYADGSSNEQSGNATLETGAQTNNTTESKEEAEEDPKESAAANITVNVEPNTPVTINVDGDMISTMTKSREINVHVREVSEQEMVASKVVTNSQQKGIITSFDPGLNDVPITLPFSAYRCTIRPVNWFDVIRLTAPSSGNQSDAEMQRWSIIYRHIKNPSIGDFEDFEDFLKKTKFDDRELLMWALLTATSDDEEEIQMPCINKKCRHMNIMKYCPRTIIHTNDEAANRLHYFDIHNAMIGPDAVKVWQDLNMKHRAFKLPNTGIVVEVNRPSAYEYITEKLPLMKILFERVKPDMKFEAIDLERVANDPTMLEYNMLLTVAMFVSAVTITKNGIDYRYTNWEDIENITSNMLDFNDSGILINMIMKERSADPPVSFYLSDVVCPKCGRKDEKLIISDIANTLLFQLSRRFQNTTVNLIET